MKIPILLGFILTLAACHRLPDTPQTKVDRALEPPTEASLTERPIVGTLGIPLGTAAEIRATIVAGRETRLKQYHSRYLLRVTEVNGHPLTPSHLMEFSEPGFASVKLPEGVFELYELKNGARAGRLDSAQIDELEKGYVGRQVHLVAYELGGYSGVPRNLPDDVPVWQDHGFGFSTWLVVLAERPN